MSTDNGSGGSGGVPQFRKFVSEAEVEEKKRQRQEEWERVRKPQDPVEAPPEKPEDNRSLYDRLQEQKNMKQAEYEEKFQLKNQVRGLDDEEANFLDEVSRQQENIQREKDREERDLLEEYRNSVANRVTAVKPTTTSSTAARPTGGDTKHKPSQAQLLAGVVKRKRTNSSTDDSPKQKEAKKSTECSENDGGAAENKEETRTNDGESNPGGASVMVCAGVLPGIGVYRESDSDNSDSSSDSDIDTDLFRRTKVIHASADH